MESLSKTIGTRADLDAIAGTPEHAAFMGLLAGSLWRLEKDDAAQTWVAVPDDSTVGRFGFSRLDFPGAQPPALPVYVPPVNPRIDEIRARLAAIDKESIRAMRSKQLNRGNPADNTKLTALEDEADALRAELGLL